MGSLDLVSISKAPLFFFLRGKKMILNILVLLLYLQKVSPSHAQQVLFFFRWWLNHVVLEGSGFTA